MSNQRKKKKANQPPSESNETFVTDRNLGLHGNAVRRRFLPAVSALKKIKGANIKEDGMNQGLTSPEREGEHVAF